MSDLRMIPVIVALLVPAAASAQSLPDPTEPTAMAGQRSDTRSSAPRWVLHSTLVADGRRVATINGDAVAVGDTVDGARVVRIEPYAVRIRTADGIMELTLTDGDPKQVAQGGPK